MKAEENKINMLISDEIGFGMPKISISSIELSNSNPLLQGKQDPHIDFAGEVNIASLDKITDANENTSLAVKIRMSFKETLDPNGDFTYISEGDDLKYIKIAIFQSLNENTTSQITNSAKDLLNPRSGQYFQKPFIVSGLSKKVTSINNVIENGTNIYLNELDKAGGFENADLSVKNIINQIPYSKAQDTQGNIVYTIPLERTFYIEPNEGGSNPQHLAYFVFSYFDVDEFIQDAKEKFGQIFTNDNFFNFDNLTSNMMSDVSSDIVILNGEPQNESFVFVDPQGRYYTGPRHQMLNGQYMKGAYHLEGQKFSPNDYLEKVTVYNSKLIDNREVAKVNKVNFNYSKIGDFVINPDSFQQSWLENSDLYKALTPMFSDMWSSIDISGNNRFIFSINMENLLLRNTVYKGLITTLKNSESIGLGVFYSSLIKQIKIKELKITRRRVKKQITLNAEKGGQRVDFSDSDAPLLIVSSVDQNGKLVSKVEFSNDLGLEKTEFPVKVGTISEIKLDGTPSVVRSFMCTDLEVSGKSSGMYEYTLEVQSSDPVPLFLLSKIQELQLILDGSSSTPGWKEYLSVASQPQYFDSYLNRFNTSFLKAYQKSFPKEPGQLGFVDGSIFQFCQLLAAMDSTNSFDTNVKILQMMDYFIKISHPSTGSPQGIQTVIEFISNTITSFQKLLSNTTSYKKITDLVGASSPHAQGGTPIIAGATAQKTFKVSHVFKSLFTAIQTSINNPSGYDFLSLNQNSSANNLGGLRLINADTFKSRFDLETSKLFTNENAEITIKDQDGKELNSGDTIDNKKYSFLSPSYVYLPSREPGNILSAGTLSNADINDLSDLMLDVIRFNTDELAWSSGKIESQTSKKGNLVADTIQSPLPFAQGGIPPHLDLPVDVKNRRFDLVQHFASKGCTIETEGAPVNNNKSEGKNNNTNFVPGSLWQTPISQSEIDDFMADVGSIFISQEFDILNSPVNPNKFLYSLMALSDLDFYKKDLNPNMNKNSRIFYNVGKPNRGKLFKKKLKKDKTFINNLPNHTKSLLMLINGPAQEVASNSMTLTFKEEKKDAFKDPIHSAFINFNYRMLNRIQVFTGFENSTFVNNQGKWEDLTLNKLNTIKGGEESIFYLCRQVRYYDEFSVEPPKLLEMPVFDQYFILTSKTLSVFDSNNSLESFFSNDSSENTTNLDSSGQQLSLKALKIIQNKESMMQEGQRGSLTSEMMQNNLIKNNYNRPPPPSIPAPGDPQTINEANNKDKFEVVKKLSLLDQKKMIQSMGLAKVAKISVSDISAGGVVQNLPELTEKEKKLLETSSTSEKVKDNVKKLGLFNISSQGSGGGGGGNTGGTY